MRHGANWNHESGILNFWIGVVLLCIYMLNVHAFGEETEDICNCTVQVAEHRDRAQRGSGTSLPGISKRCLDTVLSSMLWGILSEQGDALGDPQWSFHPDPRCGEAAEVQATLSGHPEKTLTLLRHLWQSRCPMVWELSLLVFIWVFQAQAIGLGFGLGGKWGKEEAGNCPESRATIWPRQINKGEAVQSLWASSKTAETPPEKQLLMSSLTPKPFKKSF